MRQGLMSVAHILVIRQFFRFWARGNLRPDDLVSSLAMPFESQRGMLASFVMPFLTMCIILLALKTEASCSRLSITLQQLGGTYVGFDLVPMLITGKSSW